jgi:hypothetical protein
VTDQTPLPLAAGPKQQTPLVKAGRYEGAASKRFLDLCKQADQGEKYNLDDELSVLRGLLAKLVEGIEDGTKPSEMVQVTKAIREVLKQAAEFEQMRTLDDIRGFLASCMHIIKEEVKDETISDRIGRRIQLLPF